MSQGEFVGWSTRSLATKTVERAAPLKEFL